MTAEPPPLTPIIAAPGKEAEIAALTDAIAETTRRSFVALSPEKQGELLVEFAALVSKSNADIYDQTINRIKNATLLSVAGSLKDHPLNDEYARIMQEQREERRKEAERLYPDEDTVESAA